MATWLRAGAALAAAAALAIVVWQMRGAPGPFAGRVRSDSWFRRRKAEGSTTRSRATFLAVSPDGTQLAYVGVGREGRGEPRLAAAALFLRGRPIAGTEGANSIMWSPDGRSIAFFTRDKLKRVEVAGGAPVPICDIPAGGGKAGTWGRSDIVFTSIQGAALYRVPASGGQPVIVIKADASHVESRLGVALVSSRRRAVPLPLARARRPGNLMLAEPGKRPAPIGRIASFFQYLEPGFLVYSREGTLVAQRFDSKSGARFGRPDLGRRARPVFLFDGGGRLRGARRNDRLRLAAGREPPRLVRPRRPGGRRVGASGNYLDLRLTADGKRLLFDRARPGLETYHVWSYDLERGVETPMTNGLDTEVFPQLLADGKSLDLLGGARHAALAQPPRPGDRPGNALTEGRRAFQMAEDVSPDGRSLVFVERSGPGNFDIWSIVVDGKAAPVPLLQSSFNKH